MPHDQNLARLRPALKRPLASFMAFVVMAVAVDMAAFFFWLPSVYLMPLHIFLMCLIALTGYRSFLKFKKGMDRALSAQQAYYQGILASRHESVFVIDRNYLICDLSDSFLKKSGLRRDDVIGRPCYLITRQRSTRCPHDNNNQCPVEYVFNTGKRKSCVQRHYRPNSEPLDIEVTAAPLRKEDGSVVLAVETVRDITEMSHLKALFLQAQKMEAVGRLAGGIAHDFNNLMNVVIGHAEMLLSRRLKDVSLRQGLENILSAGERAATLTRQLLAFSRKQIMEPRALDLNAVISNMAMMLRRIIGEDIELIVSTAADLGVVSADLMMMEQVIMNLAVNARDAMPKGGKLIIETRNAELGDDYVRTHHGARHGRYVMLNITDTGVGMTPEVKAHIFEPFFTTKESGKGTGLGLSTVFGIVKQHNGYVMAYSEPGMGATFKIYLPRVDAGVEMGDGNDIRMPTGSETILLVEDDDGVRIMAEMMLQEMGYTVISCPTGEAAIKELERGEKEIALLLTDIVMPRINGRMLAEKAAALRPGIKVMYMSGYPDSAISEKGIIEPGMHFIQKPFTSSFLARKVREAIDA